MSVVVVAVVADKVRRSVHVKGDARSRRPAIKERITGCGDGLELVSSSSEDEPNMVGVVWLWYIY